MLAASHRPSGKLFATPARRVLVADGDVDAADRLTLLLRAEGCRVSVCYDGPTALLMARACRPEVALLGLELPGLSGPEVARRLRQDACGRPLLVALTGHAGEGHRPASDAGFDALLVNPVAPAEFRHLLAA